MNLRIRLTMKQDKSPSTDLRMASMGDPTLPALLPTHMAYFGKLDSFVKTPSVEPHCPASTNGWFGDIARICRLRHPISVVALERSKKWPYIPMVTVKPTMPLAIWPRIVLWRVCTRPRTKANLVLVGGLSGKGRPVPLPANLWSGTPLPCKRC